MGDYDLLRLLHFWTAGREWCTVCQGRHSLWKRSQPAESIKTITWYHNIYNEIASDVWRYQSYKDDLGVTFDEKLTFQDHIHDKVHKAYAMLGLIRRNFKYISINNFILLYKSMVRSLLDYCVPVLVPYKKGDIEVLEKVQKKATKIIPEIRICHRGSILKHVSCQCYITDKSEEIWQKCTRFSLVNMMPT